MSLRNRREIRVGGRHYIVTSWSDPEPVSREGRIKVWPASDRESAIVLERATMTSTSPRGTSGRTGSSPFDRTTARRRNESATGYRVWRVEADHRLPATMELPKEDVAPPQELSWITLRVVDDSKPPQPVGNVRVKVRAPGGREFLKTTDNDGILHIDGINPGQCEVSFPDFDEAADAKTEAQPGKLIFRLPVDPSETKSRDDKFTLTALNDPNLKIVKTIADDTKPGDRCVDLIFEDLDTSDFYTLTIDPGKEGAPYILRHPQGWLFEDVSYETLASMMNGG